MKSHLIAALVALGMTVPSLFAMDKASATLELSGVPRPELPAKAAKLVVAAQGKDRSQATEAITKAAVELNPVAAPMTVSSVCKLSPDMAPVVASAAAALQPKQMRAIAKAAAAAAPSQALKIVAALCKSAPKSYKDIAGGVSEAVRGMDSAIIAAVVDTIPTLKPFYVRATQSFASVKNTAPSASLFFTQVERDMEIAAKSLQTTTETLVAQGVPPTQLTQLPQPPAPPLAPVIQPPFTGITGSPSEINRNQTVDIPPGTPRDYSAP